MPVKRRPLKRVVSKTPISPQAMQIDPKRGLVCPWCPPHPVYGVVYIVDGERGPCPHNPFILMKRVRELETELHAERLTAYKARAFVEAFRELNREIEEEGT